MTSAVKGSLAPSESPALWAEVAVLAEPIDLMHPFVQDRHDADVAVRQSSPIDEMSFVSEEIPVDAELGRNGSRYYAVRSDLFESLEQTDDVAIRLFGAPMVPRVAVNLVETVGGRFLDRGQQPSGQVRFRAMTSAGVSGLYDASGAAKA